MEYILDTFEARILGVLIEKEMSTPDYYPMTLNALVNACNQKSNREPVMELDESAVTASLDKLRDRRLVWQVRQQNSRALKYEHNLKDIYGFSDRELAIICELLLRGPQTTGELRSRCSRLTEFGALQLVEQNLQKLMKHEKGPFAVQLARRPGQKENRFAHLFFGPDQAEDMSLSPQTDEKEEMQADRIRSLEEKILLLETEIEELKKQFTAFQKQFE